MKTLQERVWERATKIALARYNEAKKNRKYEKRLRNRQALYLRRKALGRI